jgi:hypothetical protein
MGRTAQPLPGPADLICLNFSDVIRALGWGGSQMNVGGDLDDAPMLYWKESPISRIAEVRTLLLLLHGKKDENVSNMPALLPNTMLLRNSDRRNP